MDARVAGMYEKVRSGFYQKYRVSTIPIDELEEIYNTKENKEGEENLIDNTFDYVVDAVDTVSTKIKLMNINH